MEYHLRVPRVYVVVLECGTPHSVYLDQEMHRIQVEALRNKNIAHRSYEMFLNSSIKVGESSHLPDNSIVHIPAYESDDDSNEESHNTNEESDVAEEEELLALYRKLDELNNKKISAEMEYEDVVSDYHKQRKRVDMMERGYKETDEKFEEFINIFHSDQNTYNTIVASIQKSIEQGQDPPFECPALFQQKFDVFAAMTPDMTEEQRLQFYIEHYPKNEIPVESSLYRTLFLAQNDDYWDKFFSQSVYDKIQDSYRRSNVSYFYQDLRLFKNDALEDADKILFFDGYTQHIAQLERERHAAFEEMFGDAATDDYNRYKSAFDDTSGNPHDDLANDGSEESLFFQTWKETFDAYNNEKIDEYIEHLL